MDLRQLEILCAIAETGSFTGAGEKLHVSQSAVSRQVLLLEEELRQPLFIRQGRGTVPTRAGHTLIALGRRLAADLSGTVGKIRDDHGELEGTVCIAGGMTICLYVFPLLLKEFRRLHPRVDVHLITGSSTRIMQQVRSGIVDIALLTLPVEDPACEVVPVLREELLLAMPPNHRLARQRQVSPSDLAHEPFVLFEPRSNTRRTVDRLFTSVGITPRVILETENVEILKALVVSGMGLSFIPYQSIAKEVRARQLSSARITGTLLERETGWVYLRSPHVPRAMQEVIRTLERVRSTLTLAPSHSRAKTRPPEAP